MIIKYVYNGNIICSQYDDAEMFLKDCYKPEFKDTLFDAKDVIVLENNGCSFTYNSLVDVYQKYVNFVVT